VSLFLLIVSDFCLEGFRLIPRVLDLSLGKILNLRCPVSSAKCGVVLGVRKLM